MISVIGIPYDENSSYLSGCRLAPPAIRNALTCASSNTFAEDETPIADQPGIEDQGDLELGTGEIARQQIEAAITDQLQNNRRVLSLGGDHAITYPILRAYASKFGKVTVLQLDAHPDLYDELDDNQFSHACPFARALEENLVDRLVQVGVRTMNAHQREQADRFGVEVVTMQQWSRSDKVEIGGPVYLTLDLDVLDPAFVPGISHYEPGGMSVRELIGLIQDLDARLIGADIVELNPSRDIQNITAMVAAKCYKEILAAMLRRS